jgi:hypothetical protein
MLEPEATGRPVLPVSKRDVDRTRTPDGTALCWMYRATVKCRYTLCAQ